MGWRLLKECSKYRIWTRLVCWFRRYARQQIENLKNIILVTRIFPGKADSAILLGFECTLNPQNFMKFVWAISEKIKILNIFLMWTTLNFDGRSKTKRWDGDICKGTLEIEFEQDWSIGLGAISGLKSRIGFFYMLFNGVVFNLLRRCPETYKWSNFRHLLNRWNTTPLNKINYKKEFNIIKEIALHNNFSIHDVHKLNN